MDFVGQATSILKYAGEVEGKGRSEDDLAFLRYEREYKNLLLVEQPNGDFGMTMMRQFLFDAFRKPLFERLVNSTDEHNCCNRGKVIERNKVSFKTFCRMGYSTWRWD